ncbi:MAG: hypothetical protein JJD92_04235 [Frankiaceae bacterium]|nr:hypothetical protein [Frankiaceae bacterium]
MLAFTRWTLTSSAALTLALSGCANISGSNSDAPDPAKALPAPIASAVKTDIGQYLVRPKSSVSAKDIQATIDQLRLMPGVQSADLKDGVVDVQFLGGSTAAQRENAVKQLAALGEVYEGI